MDQSEMLIYSVILLDFSLEHMTILLFMAIRLRHPRIWIFSNHDNYYGYHHQDDVEEKYKRGSRKAFSGNLERKLFKIFVATKQTTSSPKTVLNIALVISHFM